MRTILIAALLVASPALAEGEFSEGSEAKPWGLTGEEKARFEAKVVDVLCELTGDCPANCGDGARQLGLLRAADGALVLANKNGQPLFNGAGADLLPYCNEDVEVDGLLVGSTEVTDAKLYMVQLIRRAGEEEWSKTDRWLDVWNENHPDLAGQDAPWFRKDPRIQALIAENGYFGLGLEEDQAIIEELFE